MGNDGGDIPKRKQLVKQKKKQQFANSQSIAMARARFCNLTNQPLSNPLAICKLGFIYNYQRILKAAVEKTLPSKYAYIKKLSDIKQIKIERTNKQSVNYIACPITKLEYNGFNKFVALWTCGHVLSRKAFQVIKSENPKEPKCIICNIPYKEKDMIDLNLQGEQLNKRRDYLIKKNEKKEEQKKQKDQQQVLGLPKKKVKVDPYVNPIDRLGGQFRDVVRQRQQFKGLFHKN